MEIHSLLPHEQYYLPQETGNYSVAGFRIVIDRKVSHYIITYYIPSGLFVVVSWASFLIPCDDIQVSCHSGIQGGCSINTRLPGRHIQMLSLRKCVMFMKLNVPSC